VRRRRSGGKGKGGGDETHSLTLSHTFPHTHPLPDTNAPSSPERQSPTKPAGPRRRPGRRVCHADPGRMPPYRQFATIAEIKAIMQQGVAEVPSYQAYVSRGKLQKYEQEVRRPLSVC
jgi:hypothetical protein